MKLPLLYRASGLHTGRFAEGAEQQQAGPLPCHSWSLITVRHIACFRSWSFLTWLLSSAYECPFGLAMAWQEFICLAAGCKQLSRSGFAA